MKILSYLQRISELGKSTKEMQGSINVSEVFHLWNHLVQRYNVIYLTNILETLTNDNDFKLILQSGKKILTRHVKVLEKEMMNYGIPLPTRPPKQTQSTAKLEVVSDRYSYRRILRGIHSFLPTHTIAIVHSTNPKLRDLFMSFMNEEMKLYDKFVEYGKIKGYIITPPLYRI